MCFSEDTNKQMDFELSVYRDGTKTTKPDFPFLFWTNELGFSHRKPQFPTGCWSWYLSELGGTWFLTSLLFLGGGLSIWTFTSGKVDTASGKTPMNLFIVVMSKVNSQTGLRKQMRGSEHGSGASIFLALGKHLMLPKTTGKRKVDRNTQDCNVPITTRIHGLLGGCTQSVFLLLVQEFIQLFLPSISTSGRQYSLWLFSIRWTSASSRRTLNRRSRCSLCGTCNFW